MPSLPIFTALNVPTVTSHPSVTCMQWSGDGQASILTKGAVYILTPDPGINFDTESVLTATTADHENSEEKPLGWFRTMIQIEKAESFSWPEVSQEWGAVSLGSVDVNLWAVACSPSGLTPDASCVIATLSTNLDLTLWAAAKNPLKGEWIKTHDVTPFLLESVSGDVSATSRALEAQVTSITWSSQAEFGFVPAAYVDGSFLVVGTRSGSLTFLRFDGNSSVTKVHTMKVASKWITHLAFSSWTLGELGTCEATLAYGTSDGSIGVVRVNQSLEVTPDASFGMGLRIQPTFEAETEEFCQADTRGITALTWVNTCHGNRLLISCKPGVVHLWSLCATSTMSSSWKGCVTLVLKTQKLSVGSSALHQVSGMHYVQRRDALVISLFDGSFHVVHNASSTPSLSLSDPDDILTTEKLSKMSRQVFSQAEHSNVDFLDVNRISGMISYDTSSTVLWVHEACRPSDFSYKHDARHNSMFIAVQLWDDNDDEVVLKQLADVLNTAKASAGSSPLNFLRPSFFHLRKAGKLSLLHHRVLEILQPEMDDHSVNINVPLCAGELTPDVRRDFKKSLARHLFGWDVLLSLRMRLSMADFAWKLSQDPSKQADCGTVAQNLLNMISHRILRTIIRHLAAIVPVLTASDVPFVLRMVVQSLLPGSPPDLSIEAETLSTAMQMAMSMDPGIESMSRDFNELCPACNVQVPLQDITTAICSNGHTWGRCSITTFILSTPQVRTCIGCSRKAFLPLSSPKAATMPNWLPVAARGWVVEELLEAVHRCLFCGNSFVSVL